MRIRIYKIILWDAEKMEKKKASINSDNRIKKIVSKKAVLIAAFLLILIAIIHFIMPAEYSLADDDKVEKDFKTLNNHIEALDKKQINATISKANFDVKLQEVGGNKGKLDNRFIFSNSVLIGDSMAEGIVDYRILDSSNVFAKRGKRLATSEELFDQAIKASPENLFIEFGMNDIISYSGKEKPFIKEYKGIIKKLKKELPNTNLYVVSISTISPLGIKNKPSMKNFTGYNQKMKEMCKQENITFVDTTLLLDNNSGYEFDGIHPKEPFYSNWVKLMCSYILENSEV